MYNSVSMAMAVREGYLRPVTMARPVEFCVLLDDNKVVEFCMCILFLSSFGEGGRGSFEISREREGKTKMY